MLPLIVSRQTLATLLKVAGGYTGKVPGVDAADGALRLVHFCVCVKLAAVPQIKSSCQRNFLFS